MKRPFRSILSGQAAELTKDTFDQILAYQLFGKEPRTDGQEYVLTCEDTTCRKVFTAKQRIPYCMECTAVGQMLLALHAHNEMRWGIRPI